MELNTIKDKTTWNEAAESINGNSARIISEFDKLTSRIQEGQGINIDEMWSELTAADADKIIDISHLPDNVVSVESLWNELAKSDSSRQIDTSHITGAYAELMRWYKTDE